MTNKKILYFEDLVKFFEENKIKSFSSKESGYQLAVQVPAELTFKEDNSLNNSGMLYCKLRVCHTNLNRNGSFISEENMKKALPSLKYRPLLAHIHQLDDGTWDFHSHDMEITDDGVEYIEKQIGAFTADEAYLEYDEEMDKTYVIAYAAIPEDYTMAADIIKSKNGTIVSCELSIESMSYNAKEKYLELEDFYFSGCACLGSEKDGKLIQPGMEGARLDIVDFSQENNSIISYSEENQNISNKLIETLEALNNTLSKFNINDSKESEETYRKEEIVVESQEILVNEEVIETEEVVEEIETNSEETVDEPVEVTEVESTEEVTETEEVEDPVEDETPEVVEEESEETVDEEFEENTDVVDSEGNDEPEQFAEKLVRTYEISHDDIRWALYNLLALQEDADGEWYFINAVYDNHFTYESWSGEKIYGQSYTKEDDNVSFDGERWNLHRELLTDSEYAELVSMRANYASLAQFKEDTENAQLHTQREAILYDEKYSVIAEKDEDGKYVNEAFAKLVSEMDNYSLTDLEKELKSVFADYITNGGKFAYIDKTSESAVTKKTFAVPTSKKTSRYGNLFK